MNFLKILYDFLNTFFIIHFYEIDSRNMIFIQQIIESLSLQFGFQFYKNKYSNTFLYPERYLEVYECLHFEILFESHSENKHTFHMHSYNISSTKNSRILFRDIEISRFKIHLPAIHFNNIDVMQTSNKFLFRFEF